MTQPPIIDVETPVVIPNNTLTALPKDTRSYTLEFPLTDGDGGADTMESSPEDEKFFGLGGNDVLNAKAGNDYLDGGAGDDKLYGDFGDDYLLGGVGADSIYGGEGNDSIDGGIGNDGLYGENGNDLIADNSGDNTLNGQGGNDTLSSGAGSDNLQGDSGNDSIDGGSGNDSIDGGSGNDTIDGYYGVDTIHGGDGNDSIRDWANSGEANMIYGDAGDDSIVVAGGELHGGVGNDYLEGYWLLMGDEGFDTLVGRDNTSGTFIGGLDADKITTDGGADIVRYMTVADSKPGGATRDVITDFDTSSGDVMDLYRVASNPLTYLGMKAFDGTKGAVRFTAEPANARTIVQVDTNGDKAPDMEIELTGLKFLAADDFILSAPRV